MNYNIYRIFLCFLCLCGKICFSQKISSNIKYQVESGVYLSTSGKMPFLLRSNQYGIVPLESEFLTLRGAAHKEYDSTMNQQKQPKKFSYGYGLNTVINVGKSNQILFPEAYIKLRYGTFEFYGGRRREILGLVDTLLTSGSYIWSGNALPMPKIQISIPNYTSIIGHGLISIKGAFVHGWFDNGFVKNFYLHQKWIYGRVGKPNWKVKFYGGFNHQVQWGGRPQKPYIETLTGTLISKYPSDFDTYLKVVTGVSLNKNDTGTAAQTPLNDAWNRAGNHLGTIDIATEINLINIDILFYRQSIYEDGSLFYLSNISDGLSGFFIKRKKVKQGIFKFGFEYINTTSQGGSIGSDNTIPELRGRDNYFNNTLYINAWTYKSNVLGTPLIAPISQINKTLISKYDYSTVPKSFIGNNRIQGYTFSFSGRILNANFNTRLIYTKNSGIYDAPFIAKQFSFLQQISYNLPKYTINSSIAFDNGKLLNNSLGCYLGIRRRFF